MFLISGVLVVYFNLAKLAYHCSFIWLCRLMLFNLKTDKNNVADQYLIPLCTVRVCVCEVSSPPGMGLLCFSLMWLPYLTRPPCCFVCVCVCVCSRVGWGQH